MMDTGHPNATPYGHRRHTAGLLAKKLRSITELLQISLHQRPSIGTRSWACMPLNRDLRISRTPRASPLHRKNAAANTVKSRGVVTSAPR